jgi:hypothetical protein
VGAGFAVGLLPAVAPNVVLRSQITPPRAWPVVLEASFYGSERAASRGGAIPFSLDVGGLLTCPFVLTSSEAALAACGGVQAGLIATRGLASDQLLEHSRFVATGVARLEGSLNLGSSLVLAVSPSAVVPLVRDSFVYDSNGEQIRVFRMAPVAFAGDLTLGLRIP